MIHLCALNLLFGVSVADEYVDAFAVFHFPVYLPEHQLGVEVLSLLCRQRGEVEHRALVCKLNVSHVLYDQGFDVLLYRVQRFDLVL